MNDYFVPITWAEIEALGQKGIGALGIRAYMVIKMRAYGNRASSYSSQETIRKELRAPDGSLPSLRGLQKAIKKLETAGLIKSKTRGSCVGTNEYTITSKLVPEPEFDTRNHSTNDSSTDSLNTSSSETLNQSSSKEDNLNLIYYNNKGNIIEYITLSSGKHELINILNSIVDEPNTFYMTHTDDDIESMKKFINTIDNPDELVCSAVEVLISFRDWV